MDTFSQTFPITDFTHASMDTLFQDIEKIQHKIENTQYILFAAEFIHYFHKNPEAKLFICGETEQMGDGFIVRIDFNYVEEQLSTLPKNYSTAEHYNIGCGLSRIEQIKYLDIHNRIYDYYARLMVDDFKKFRSIPYLSPVWNEIGHVSERGLNHSGMIYGRENLDELLTHFLIDHEALKANIEKSYLNQNITLTPRKSLAL